MAALRVFLTLAMCVMLGNAEENINPKPCMKPKKNGGDKTFVNRHIGEGAPTSRDEREWKNYIEGKKLCHRTTQSFLKSDDADAVKQVCSDKGSMMKQKNLCISHKEFTFVTVTIKSGRDPKKCEVESVEEETKHLILGCDRFGSDCLPVHFEGNPNKITNAGYPKPCRSQR